MIWQTSRAHNFEHFSMCYTFSHFHIGNKIWLLFRRFIIIPPNKLHQALWCCSILPMLLFWYRINKKIESVNNTIICCWCGICTYCAFWNWLNWLLYFPLLLLIGLRWLSQYQLCLSRNFINVPDLEEVLRTSWKKCNKMDAVYYCTTTISLFRVAL